MPVSAIASLPHCHESRLSRAPRRFAGPSPTVARCRVRIADEAVRRSMAVFVHTFVARLDEPCCSSNSMSAPGQSNCLTQPDSAKNTVIPFRSLFVLRSYAC